MTEDDVLREVRAARGAYASLHNFDVHAIVKDLRARDTACDWPVVRRAPRRAAAVSLTSKTPQQTGAA